jgi:formate C-acetyltransferase
MAQIIKEKTIVRTIQEERFKYTELSSTATSRIERLKTANIEAEVGLIAERARIYTEVYKETESEPEAIRRAKAFARTIREMEIDIEEDQLIVANSTAVRKKMQVYPEIWSKSFYKELQEMGTREDSPFRCSEEDIKVLLEEVYPYWKDRNMVERFMKAMPEEMLSLWFMDPKAEILDETRVFGTLTDILCLTNDQISVDFDKVLEKGLRGMKELAERSARKFIKDVIPGRTDPDNVERYNFCKAVAIAYEAAQDFVERYAKLARQKAEEESDENRKRDLFRIYEVCGWISENPPRTFWEALQLVQFIIVGLKVEGVANSWNLGRWDQYLYPFYKKDIEEGRATKDEIQELIDCFWIKCADYLQPRPSVGAIMYGGYATWHTLDISGMKPDGSDGTNELSWMALQATANTRLFQPDVSVLYHHQIPDDFLKRACEVGLLGTGHPKFYNHDNIVSMVMIEGQGRIPIETARTTSATGCTEHLILHKRSYNPSGVAHGNLAGCLEFALNNGRGRMVDRQFGPETGDPTKFKSFDQFVQAFRNQLEHLVKMISAAEAFSNAAAKGWLYNPFQCGTREDLIENGVDFTANMSADYLKSEPYGWAVLVLNGFADCAEGFHVIDELVFKRKMITMDELIGALGNNFGGEHERIKDMIENEITHYGNDDREADKYAEMVSKMISESSRKYDITPGNVWSWPDILSLTINVGMGSRTGALPSGKKAGMPNADASGPVYGFDKQGPTATLRSVAKSCAKVSFETGAPNENLLNIRFQPDLIYCEGGIDNWAALVRMYHEAGGQHVQFNVVSTETLRDAQEHPEKYPDLLVRVAGYSAYFTSLAKPIQDDIISRTEYESW